MGEVSVNWLSFPLNTFIIHSLVLFGYALSAMPHIPFETIMRSYSITKIASLHSLHYTISFCLSTTCLHSNTVSSKTHVSILSNTVLTISSVLSVSSSSLLCSPVSFLIANRSSYYYLDKTS